MSTTTHTRINAQWRHGDDSRAARWLRRYHGLRYRPQCMRYFRTQPNAYAPELRQLFTRAYMRIQRHRAKHTH